MPSQRMSLLHPAAFVLLALLTGASGVSAQSSGEDIYSIKCAPCHMPGLLGAPKYGSAEDWKSRLDQGRATLLANAMKGINKMPPRGGDPGLPEASVAAALDYMLAGLEKAAAAPPRPAAPAAKPQVVRVSPRGPSGANSFNRLMKPPSQRNLPPARDGIHDPENEGTHALQAPRDAFDALPNAIGGNRVDWVKALNERSIAPRYDRLDPNAAPVVMDLNIVREVKGSMPNVVYPHEAHTQWLDCSNCHPAIFVPQKGANQMSMAGILLGKQCGVCHGKVAFPVSDCRRCHSGNKPK